MRTTTTESGWKRAMLHAWLGFLLLLAFYLLSFGIPGRKNANPAEQETVERTLPAAAYRVAVGEVMSDN
ncbi:MAG: hypothetical protein WA004_04015 [Saprospiraceae bacterium]